MMELQLTTYCWQASVLNFIHSCKQRCQPTDTDKSKYLSFQYSCLWILKIH